MTQPTVQTGFAIAELCKVACHLSAVVGSPYIGDNRTDLEKQLRDAAINLIALLGRECTVYDGVLARVSRSDEPVSQDVVQFAREFLRCDHGEEVSFPRSFKVASLANRLAAFLTTRDAAIRADERRKVTTRTAVVCGFDPVDAIERCIAIANTDSPEAALEFLRAWEDGSLKPVYLDEPTKQESPNG